MHMPLIHWPQRLRHLLLVAVLLLSSPAAFAKRDLFGADPAAKQNPHTQELIAPHKAETALQESSSSASSAPGTPSVASTNAAEKKDTSSYAEKQWIRFKSHLIETRNNLFGKNERKHLNPPTTATEANNTTSQDTDAPLVTALSSTEAAQRAQRTTEGQVMTVRQYQDNERVLYAVKLLQKNGRMKTVNIDANTGDVVEETPQ